MAKWAYVKEDVISNLESTGGILKLTLVCKFWDDASEPFVEYDNEQVDVTFDIDALVFGANAAIVNALQAHALATWDWDDLPANHCVHRQLARGTL